MYNITSNGYKNNIIYESTARQLSFVFERIIFFIEEGDRYRNEGNFEAFSIENQRAISSIHAVASFLQSELPENVAREWDKFFLRIINRLNIHIIEPNPNIYKELCENLKYMSDLIKDYESKNIEVPSPHYFEGEEKEQIKNSDSHKNNQVDSKAELTPNEFSNNFLSDLNVSI